MKRAQHHPKLEEIEVTFADAMREEGRAQGRAQGLATGLATGRMEGRRELLVGLLEGRFGDLSEPVRRKVERIGSAERLDELAKKLLVARSLDELGLG